MQLRYDEDFIEAAVFLGASGRRKGVPAMQIARFHREREKLYAILDPEERNTAFFKLHLDWFREWGLERPLTDVLKEFSLVREQIGVLAVRKTTGKNDEGAELYVNDTGQRTGLLALRPEWIATGSVERSAGFRPLSRENNQSIPAVPESLQPQPVKRAEARAPLALADFLRHEFMHLHDMLDPSFGYTPELDLPGLNAAQKRLARERYRLLWDITIDARLAAVGHRPMAGQEEHAAAFARGYSFWPEEKRVATFNSLWQTKSPRHVNLLALIADPRGLRDAHRPAPGASCPLCDFPTFQWADPCLFEPRLVHRITAEFPNWSPEHGICNRCWEAYQVNEVADCVSTS
jgi:hypothetical protein